MTYILSIEDRIGTGANVTERAVVVEDANGFKTEEIYNPNQETGPFNSNGPFNTSFSIVHPFRLTAVKTLASHCLAIRSITNQPEIKYHSSVNDAQKTLFGNILAQEYEKVKKRENEGYVVTHAIHCASEYI